MNILQFIAYFSEVFTTVVTVFLAIYIIKKDSKYLGNILVGTGIASIGGFTFSVFLLNVLSTEWAIKIFLPIGMAVIMHGAMCLYFGFQVLANSVNWFNEKMRWVPHLMIWIVYTIWILVDRSLVNVISLEPSPVVQFNLAALAIMAVFSVFFLIKSMIEVKKSLKVVDGVMKKRMLYFQNGIRTLVVSIILVVLANVSHELIFLMTIFFYVLLIGAFIIAYAFLKSFQDEEEKMDEEKQEKIEKQ